MRLMKTDGFFVLRFSCPSGPILTRRRLSNARRAFSRSGRPPIGSSQATESRLETKLNTVIAEAIRSMDDVVCHGQFDSQVEVHLRARLGIAYHNVSVDYKQGTVTLHGRVASYYHKQLAQEAVIKLDPVQEVVNRIEVSA